MRGYIGVLFFPTKIGVNVGVGINAPPPSSRISNLEAFHNNFKGIF